MYNPLGNSSTDHAQSVELKNDMLTLFNLRHEKRNDLFYEIQVYLNKYIAIFHKQINYKN